MATHNQKNNKHRTEIKRLNEALEQRVLEQTRELTATNEALRTEITERKRTAAALYQERAFVSTVLDTVDALMVVTDTRGRIVRFNRACQRLTGYAVDEVQNAYLERVAEFPGLYSWGLRLSW